MWEEAMSEEKTEAQRIEEEKLAKRRAYWAWREPQGDLSRGQRKRLDYHKRMEKRANEQRKT